MIPHYLPIPEPHLALATEAISRRVARIPFTEQGIVITPALVAVVMECLNAESTRTLPVHVPDAAPASAPSLERSMAARLSASSPSAAPVLSGVLCRAEIAEPAEILVKSQHATIRGVRLLPAWRWDIASPARQQPLPAAAPMPAAGDDAWLAKCPVCSAGLLSRIVGRRLFGIPPVDYYIDCSHCGAKFIPERQGFRLVSVARIADPRWRKLLNTCRTPDEWAALNAPKAALPHRMAEKLAQSSSATRPRVALAGAPAPFLHIRDGSIAVPCGGRTLYFRPVRLQFIGGAKAGVFMKSERPVADILDLPAFSPVAQEIRERYPQYLNRPLGLLAADLARQNDPLLAGLLNRSGNLEFSMFRMQEGDLSSRKGVCIVHGNGTLCHTGTCTTSFSALINHELGRITADMCYRDGNEPACRINAVVSAFRDQTGIYVHPLSDEGEAREIAAAVSRGFPDTLQGE